MRRQVENDGEWKMENGNVNFIGKAEGKEGK